MFYHCNSNCNDKTCKYGSQSTVHCLLVLGASHSAETLLLIIMRTFCFWRPAVSHWSMILCMYSTGSFFHVDINKWLKCVYVCVVFSSPQSCKYDIWKSERLWQSKSFSLYPSINFSLMLTTLNDIVFSSILLCNSIFKFPELLILDVISECSCRNSIDMNSFFHSVVHNYSLKDIIWRY